MKKNKSNRLDILVYIAFIIVLVLIFTNTFLIKSIANKKLEAETAVKEKLRPANLEVTKIIPQDCIDEAFQPLCNNINLALEELKKQNVNVTSEITRYDKTEEGLSLINKYGITKLPSLIIKGEVNKSEQLNKFLSDNGEIKDENTAIYTNIKPPYYDVQSNKVLGRVSITHIVDSSCSKCTSLLSLTNQLVQLGVAVSSEKKLEFNSTEGSELVILNGVDIIPAILISDEIDYYPEIKQQLEEADVKKKNNNYAMHALSPPYRDLTNNTIIGLVDFIILKDDSCKECYDTDINKQILKRFGVVVNTENEYDINSNEGKELISKYEITKVPIIILSADASAYVVFAQAWEGVGTIEEDGWFVMRNPEILGTYKDLTTNKIVEKNDQ